MKNITLFLWILLCGVVYIECGEYGWQYDPWYGKQFQPWAKAEEPKEKPEDKDKEKESEEKESEEKEDSEEKDSEEKESEEKDSEESDEEDSEEKDSEEKESEEKEEEYPFELSSDQYEDEPDMWPCLYKGCRGKQQSPINIDTEAITVDPNLGKLTFENYDKPLKDLFIKNAGFVVYIALPKDNDATVTSEWLGATYRLIGITFKYGKTNKNGSEHTVDSKYFPLEVALFHLNTKYDKVEDKPDANLVLVSLFDVGKSNKGLKSVVKSLEDVDEVDSNSTLKSPLTLKDLLPAHTDYYITYNGSSLVPECSESYKFIIFHYSNTVSKSQLEKFRSIETEKDGRDLNEVRPIQPLNGRDILSSKSGKDEKKGKKNGKSKKNDEQTSKEAQ
ncbi:carbonic anhydrase-related protein-like [Centruroides vittatus]|uniref:carbonic anhydrase-related protein-like n=1 Tax=Centruroides vittatus TaxID=120091 RepID=UPI00350FF2EF